MKCMECGEDKGIQCRGMCSGCYTRWKRAGKPPTRFDYRTPIERYRTDCQNGIVLGMLAGKVAHLGIARKYGISEHTARKYMVHYKLIVPNAKGTKKKDRKETFYTPAQMIALALPWVKNETPRYHYSF